MFIPKQVMDELYDNLSSIELREFYTSVYPVQQVHVIYDPVPARLVETYVRDFLRLPGAPFDVLRPEDILSRIT